MATLKEYFLKDFSNSLSFDFNWQALGALPSEIPVKVGMEINSNTKFIAYYVPKHVHYLQIWTSLIQNRGEAIKKSNDVEVIGGFIGDLNFGIIGSQHGVVSNRIYIYSEDEPTTGDAATIDALCKGNGLWLTIRASEYVKKKVELERPLAFISHDSRDKAEVAGPIAIGLQKMLCPVWYDEFSLKVGDHLRESIERGLKEAKKCILVLSSNFFSNNGWTKTEFNSVFTRELLEQSSVILPVWHNVTANQVYEYSPSLADRIGLKWELGQDEVVRRLYRAITAPSVRTP